MVTPLLTAALTLSSLAPRLGARSRGNVECRMEELECAGYTAISSQLSGQRREQRRERWDGRNF